MLGGHTHRLLLAKCHRCPQWHLEQTRSLLCFRRIATTVATVTAVATASTPNGWLCCSTVCNSFYILSFVQSSYSTFDMWHYDGASWLIGYQPLCEHVLIDATTTFHDSPP